MIHYIELTVEGRGVVHRATVHSEHYYRILEYIVSHLVDLADPQHEHHFTISIRRVKNDG